jgi:hypothetical protein
MAHARLSSPPDPRDRLVGAFPALQTVRTQIRHLIQFDAVGQASCPGRCPAPSETGYVPQRA